MKSRTSMLMLTLAGLLVALPVSAQRGGSSPDEQLERFERRIQRGIDSGELTRREVRSLRHEQDEVRRYIREVRRDRYPPHEARRMIERRIDRAERHLRELSNNREVAYRRDDRRDDRRGPPSRDYDDRR